MPVTVKEIIINTTIEGSDKNDSNKNKTEISSASLSKLEREIIIREAVKRALEELDHKLGR
jgi:hypothetical protein